MKKLISLVVLLLAMVAIAEAFPYTTSALEVRIADYGHYTVQINGQSYRTTSGVLNIDRLVPGHYRLRVIKHARRGGGHRAVAVNQVVYHGRVFLPEHTLLQANYRRGGMYFQQIEMGVAPPTYVDYRPRYERPMGMQLRSFDGLLSAMRQTPFDRTKLEIARAALSNHQVSTEQVRHIMRQFSFDSNKLDIAKYAFDSVVDPEHYYSLSQEFTFDSNARALMAYIH